MSAVEARDRYLNAVKRDLFGPALGENEVLKLEQGASPTDLYLTGIISPLLTLTPSEDDDTAELNVQGEAEHDDPIAMHSIKRPASCGMSFAVDGKTTGLNVSVTGGKYTLHDEGSWVRRPVARQLAITLESGLQSHPVGDDLSVHVRCREVGSGDRQVTVVLQNDLRPTEFDRVQLVQGALFQTEIEVEPTGGAFVPRRVRRTSGDEDEQINDLLYRDKHEWAVGHICAAEWDDDTAPRTVSSSWFPTTLVPAMSSRGHELFEKVAHDKKLKNPFDAGELGEASRDELVARLSVLPEAYERWLEGQRKVTGDLGTFKDVASRNVDRADEISAEIRHAVELVANDDKVRRAFQDAQRAMAKQFEWAGFTQRLAWRPFQLAFQLLALPGLVLDEGKVANAEARAQMDLLWFPTGGGKTEAYLGLTAFAFFYRRLAAKTPDTGAGVTVFMRYTLRLLTIQQFERACRLVVACDWLRRENRAAYGEVPFGIGLWVGGEATPNKLSELSVPDKRQKAMQLVRCPVCGAENPWNKTNNDLEVRCKADGCAFNGERQPIYTIDEQVYEHRPSLIIGTIDKFAQIVRKAETTRLFGKPELPPPDLIIQDELHLISGPLGTIAGVYEAAIDIICSRDGVPPKVIGSTATIRRAGDQVRALFDRDVRQFPPPVIDAADSCFAVESQSDPGRLYVGVSTIGRSAKYALQSVCGALQQNADPGVGVLSSSEVDPYWTLVGYFNSLRELGGAVVMMYDDVPATRQSIANVHEQAPREKGGELIELSSRMKSEEIPKAFAQLARTYDDGQEVGVVVATNMISVGVDISRFGLMVVNGQPKSMSEYIQATSRVGRGSVAGVVVTLYNAARPRDRSHFESFKTWHQSLYAGVEPNSVTPWADRARGRTLHAAVVALARHCAGMPENGDVVLIDDHIDELRGLVQKLKERALHVDADEAAAVLKEATDFLESWARQKPEKFWWDQKPMKSLLISSEAAAQHGAVSGGRWSAFARPTPNSMRNIEPTTHVRVRNFLKLFGEKNAE